MDSSSAIEFLTSWHSLGIAFMIWILYLFGLAIYRLYFHPLADFPGPRLAALTLWYEFYWDVIQGGQWTFQIGRLHEQYGPVIRINPHELHVAPPEFYERLYAGSGKKRNKYDWFTAQIGIPDSIFGTVDHDLHRMRRAALNPFFSKGAVRRLQPIIDERIDTFLGRFGDFKKSGEPMTLDLAMAAFTNDIVMEYAFARSEHRIEAPDFDPSFHDAAYGGSTLGGITKQFPWIVPTMQSLPDKVTTWLDPNMASYVRLQNSCVDQVKQVKVGLNAGWKDVSHPTIFHELLNSDLPESEKSTARLGQDGQVTVVAGTLTTAWSLSVAVYYVLASAPILRRLKAELASAIPDPSAPISLTAIEQLPYLTAVIQESLRLSYGASSRLPRICPDETLSIASKDGKKTWHIPPGTPVSMTSTLIHHDESIFPDSHTFDPERWIKTPYLDRYLISFSKGSRQCIGINLSYAELYLFLARLFRIYGSKDVKDETDIGYLEFFETDIDDVRIHADYFIPLAKKGTKGIRVKVRDRE